MNYESSEENCGQSSGLFLGEKSPNKEKLDKPDLKKTYVSGRKTLFKGIKAIPHVRKTYLQLTHLTNDSCLEYIENSKKINTENPVSK